jgi:endonuclease/exonuclease/phosphatase family metal-dependent hydrolase
MPRVSSLLAVCVLSVLGSGCSRHLTVMSYNVAGLFDAIVDGTEYATSPKGAAAEAALRARCSIVAGAIRRSVRGGPDVVALQEVENEGVVRTLRDGWLRGLGYRWYVVAGGPPTATRVAVLSRYPLVGARSHLPAPAEGSGTQRAILEVELSVRGGRLVVLNNHWKSKIGGAAATEPARVQAARALGARIRRIISQEPAADLLVVGDLNEDHDEPQSAAGTALVRSAGPEAADAIALCADPAGLLAPKGDRGIWLYEPWLEAGVGPGSYAYGGRWSTPDHILLSAGLFDPRGLGYRAGGFRVAASPFLLDSKTGLPRGSGAGRGSEYPDHLPILVRLEAGGATAPREAPRR